MLSQERRRYHLGNIREVWRAPYKIGNTNYPAATTQRTQYYPSGLPWASNSIDHPEVQNKKYNGKEFVEMHGLDEYDSEARWYQPGIMRTTTIDPLAEKYYNISPYAWCGNNPVRNIDPDGREYLTDEDKKKAASLITQSSDRVKELEATNSGYDKQIEKATENGELKQVEDLEKLKTENTSQIGELREGIVGLNKLDEDKDHFFTFQPVDTDAHNVILIADGKKPVIGLQYSSDAIALHESKHANQYINGGKQSGYMKFNDGVLTQKSVEGKYEIQAYRLQYSFQSSSLPVPANRITDINPNWLQRLPGNPYQIR